jgi:hypothetical protein
MNFSIEHMLYLQQILGDQEEYEGNCIQSERHIKIKRGTNANSILFRKVVIDEYYYQLKLMHFFLLHPVYQNCIFILPLFFSLRQIMRIQIKSWAG